MHCNPQYQLKIGIIRHPKLKTTQLIQFLENQSNQFLANQLPQSLMISQNFIAVCEIINTETEIDYNQYVGLIILYSSSSMETYNYAKSFIPSSEQLNDLFLMFVEMDNTEKKSNVIGSDGEELCSKLGLLFIRLSLYNSEDLVTNLNQRIYLLVQNYYYPNEEERHHKNVDHHHDSPHEYILNYSNSQHKIIASKQQKYNVMGMLENVSKMRKSREKQMIQDQHAIDDSIQNVQKVLNNINKHIKQKLQSNWFTTLKNSLYKPIEKQSNAYNKIKLTQQFIEKSVKNIKQHSSMKAKQFQESIFNSRYNSTLQQPFKKLESSLMKMVIVFQESNIVELEIYQNSHFDDLAMTALKKLNINQTENNIKTMREKIKEKLQIYIKQLSKGIKTIQKQKIYQRSYLAALKK